MDIAGIESFGAPTLSGINLQGAQAGQRLQTSARQYVRFYNKTVTNLVASKVKINPKTGAETPSDFVPQEETREWVHIVTPGDKNEIDTIAEEDHKRDFWQAYQAFREGRTAPIGQPLEDCNFVPAHIVTELAVKKVFTVEQLAELPEYMCNAIAEGYQLREYARATLKASSNNEVSAQVATLRHELRQRDARAEELERKLEAMQAMIYGKGPIASEPVKAEPIKVERVIEEVQDEQAAVVAKPKGKPKGQVKNLSEV